MVWRGRGRRARTSHTSQPSLPDHVLNHSGLARGLCVKDCLSFEQCPPTKNSPTGAVCFTTIAWWAVGYGLAFGNAFGSPQQPFGGAFPTGGSYWWPEMPCEAFWFFEYSLATIVMAIVAGMVAERAAVQFFLWMVEFFWPLRRINFYGAGRGIIRTYYTY